MRERKRSCCQWLDAGKALTCLHGKTHPVSVGVRGPDLPNSPCRVPQLQAYRPVLEVHGLREEVDACAVRDKASALLTNSCLVRVIEGVVHLRSDRPRGSHGVLTNRVIRLVLPTLCSPKKTSLNFLSGDEAGNSLPPAVVGVAGVDMADKEDVGACKGEKS